jgi:hypothetical protein
MCSKSEARQYMHGAPSACMYRRGSETAIVWLESIGMHNIQSLMTVGYMSGNRRVVASRIVSCGLDSVVIFRVILLGRIGV